MIGLGVLTGYVTTAKKVATAANIVNKKVKTFTTLLLLICSILDRYIYLIGIKENILKTMIIIWFISCEDWKQSIKMIITFQ